MTQFRHDLCRNVTFHKRGSFPGLQVFPALPAFHFTSLDFCNFRVFTITYK